MTRVGQVRSYAWAMATWLVLWANSAHAAVFRIDETGTTVSHPVVQMQWRLPEPRGRISTTVEATVRIDLRLNLQPWLNRQARIFIVMAPVLGERIKANWTTQGRLAAGALSSGERAQIFFGLAGPATLEETLVLTLQADGERMERMQALSFSFEIEVDP